MKMARYCVNCGSSLPENSIFCNICGKKQPTLPVSEKKIEPQNDPHVPSYVPSAYRENYVPEKSGPSRKWLIVLAVVIITFIGFLSSSQTTPSPSPIYRAIEIFDYDSEKVVILMFDEALEHFELPKDTQSFKVEIEWMDGDKDNSLVISVFRWDEVQDERLAQFNMASLEKNNAKPKSGTKIMEFDEQTGTYYINVAMAAACRFTIKVYALLPA